MIMNRRVKTKGLTPKQAYDQYVDMNEEKFISFMRPVTDIREMCSIYASELPMVFDHEKVLFTDKQITELADLFTEYLTGYVENKGGYNKLDLWTEEEIDEYFTKEYEKSLGYMAEYFGATEDEVREAINRVELD